MCGFIFACSTIPVQNFVQTAHARQQHRGPDGEGLFFEERAGVHIGMAHQRLAIVGLGEKGTQPMLSASGKFRILFNGEIYNFLELAEEFDLDPLRSGSDTEVAVEMIERLGIEKAVQRFNGMWALVVHNIDENVFYISRDRFGKKPLYIYRDNHGIYMASEMHSLLALPSVDLTPDPVTASRFLTQSLQNVDERTWLKSISSFSSASIGEINGNEPAAGIKNLHRFWQPNLDEPLPENGEDEYIDELRHLVQDSIRLRLHADVPVGVALSGGLDSSIISVQAAEAKTVDGHPTALFSAVNPGSKEDESEHIDTMAQHLGCEVQKFQLDPDQNGGLFDLLKTCISHMDGPVSSFSNLLFYKLMESANTADITVVLTGQGADEAFCGYRKYPILEIKRLLRSRSLLEAAKVSYGFLRNDTLLPEFNFREAKRYMGASNRSILGETAAQNTALAEIGRINTLGDRQWLDVSRYSVPYLCHYEDRMSMAWSREVRAPFLDYRVVDMGMRLPERLKLAKGWTKYALRRAFEKDLPNSITWRKDKKGFVNPQDDWLVGNLQPVVRDFMERADAKVYQHGLVDRDGYIERFNDYCAGTGRVWFRDVFAPFALEIWLHVAAEIHQALKNK